MKDDTPRDILNHYIDPIQHTMQERMVDCFKNMDDYDLEDFVKQFNIVYQQNNVVGANKTLWDAPSTILGFDDLWVLSAAKNILKRRSGDNS
jgi:hypothetical protein